MVSKTSLIFSRKCIEQADEKHCAIAKGDGGLNMSQLTIDGRKHVSSINNLRKLDLSENFPFHDSFKHYL